MNIRKLGRLDDYMEQCRVRGKISGAALLVEHKGKRVYENYLGTDRKDSIYKMFSMTMPITAVAAMILYERGELDLMQRVSEYLPGFADCRVATLEGIRKAENPMLLRDLLNMTSGIVYNGDYGEAGQSMTKVYKEARIQKKSGILKNNIDVCNKFSEACLAFEPGTAFRYGLSADVMGGVIEKITGMDFSEFLLDEIFTPLNMADTDFVIDADKSFRQAVLYRRKKDGKPVRAEEDIRQKLEMDQPFDEPWYESAGSGLYATIEDYTHFAQMLLNKGSYHGKEIIGRKTLSFMTSNQLSVQQMNTYRMDRCIGYGYGNYCRILQNPAEAATGGSIGEFGWDAQTGNYFLIDPEEELIVIYMQQIDEGYDNSLIRGIRQIVYGAI